MDDTCRSAPCCLCIPSTVPRLRGAAMVNSRCHRPKAKHSCAVPCRAVKASTDRDCCGRSRLHAALRVAAAAHLQHTTCNVHHVTTCSMQQTPCNSMQHATYTTQQHATCNMTCNVVTYTMHGATCLHYTPCSMQHACCCSYPSAPFIDACEQKPQCAPRVEVLPLSLHRTARQCRHNWCKRCRSAERTAACWSKSCAPALCSMLRCAIAACHQAETRCKPPVRDTLHATC